MTASNSLVLYAPALADPEVVGVAGFLAGYSDRTREAYTLDLRQFSLAVPALTAPPLTRPLCLSEGTTAVR